MELVSLVAESREFVPCILLCETFPFDGLNKIIGGVRTRMEGKVAASSRSPPRAPVAFGSTHIVEFFVLHIVVA